MSYYTIIFTYTLLSTLQQIMKITNAARKKNAENCEKNLAREEEMLRRKMEGDYGLNGKQIQNFYTDVLATMTEKLIKEYRYTNKIHQDEIMEIQKVVKEKLNNQRLQGLNPMFKKIRQQKESIKEQFPYFNQQVFQQSIQTPIYNVISTVKEEVLEDIIYKHEIGRPAEDEDYLDDLADYIVVEESIHKKEETAPVFLKEQHNIHSQCKEEVCVKEEKCRQLQLEYQTIDEEQEKDQHYNTQIQARIGTSILGSYQSFQVKRLPKEEKILLNMQNVFVKFSNGRPENFFSSLSISLTKVQKVTIKQINN